MADMAAPRLDPDGTHVIPITGIHRPGGAPNEIATGELRWSRRDGLTFWLETPLTSAASFLTGPKRPSGGAGSISPWLQEADWIARTADGSSVSLYMTIAKTRTGHMSNWDTNVGGWFTSSQRVEGSAQRAEVVLHRDNPLTMWHDTPPLRRVFSPGWTLRGWPVNEPLTIKLPDCTQHRTRCSFPLGGPENRTLVAAFYSLDGPSGVWMTYESSEPAKRFEVPESCHNFRGLMSILLGRRAVFVWRDSPLSDERLTRLYFGGFKGIDHDPPLFQTVPVHGTVEALHHGEEVVARLVALDQRYAELRKLVDLEWLVMPLWTAEGDFIDNQLTHASVALERLSNAYQRDIRPTGQYSTPPPRMTRELQRALLSRVRDALSEFSKEKSLTPFATENVRKKIDGLFQQSNSERFERVFEELNIPLGEVERETIKMRNWSLHGQRTLKDGNDSNQCDQELRRYDVLRTLINRATLHLLSYDGPYLDYSARPDGNFPVCYATPPTVNSPPIPPEDES